MFTRPDGEARGGVLYVPPFAEEMNKSRRMAALTAEAMARDGWAVLSLDLRGCGDSSGDFGDATWQDWVDDVERGWGWLAANVTGPLVGWGLRAGALLLSSWAAGRGRRLPLLLWHPVASGKQHFNQFLRVRGVSKMLEASDARSEIATMREAIAAGQSVEVAGYLVAAELAAGVEAAGLTFASADAGPVAILELGQSERDILTPALQGVADRMVGAGLQVSTAALAGPSFWQTQEIELCPVLIDRSVAALRGLAS